MSVHVNASVVHFVSVDSSAAFKSVGGKFKSNLKSVEQSPSQAARFVEQGASQLQRRAHH